MRSRTWLGVAVGVCLVAAGLTQGAFAETQEDLADALVVQLVRADGKAFDGIVQALRPLGEPALHALAKGLDSRDPEFKLACIRAVSGMGRRARPLAPKVAEALADSRHEVRLAAMDALGRIGAPPDRDAADRLAAMMTSADASQRSSARAALLRMGAEAVGPLTRLASDRDAESRRLALGTLVELSPFQDRAVPTLARALGDTEPAVVDDAVLLLGRIGPSASKAVPQLLRLLGDDVAPPRTAAVQTALGRIGSVPAVARLRLALRQDDPALRRNAATAMGFAGPAAATAVADLTAMLTDESPEVRAAAAHALGGIGSAAGGRAEKALIQATTDPDAFVRARAVEAIGRLGLASGVPAIRARLADEDPAVPGPALLALGRLGTAAKAAAPAVVQIITQADNPSRRTAAGMIAHLGPSASAALPALREMLTDVAGEPAVAAHVRGAIIAIDPTASREQAALAVQIAAGSPEERRAALRVVAELGTAADALEPILAASRPRSDAVGDVWWRAARIRLLDPARQRDNSKEAKKLLDEIAATLSHSDPSARLAALSALDSLGPLAKPAKNAIAEAVRFEPDSAPGAYLRLLQGMD